MRTFRILAVALGAIAALALTGGAKATETFGTGLRMSVTTQSADNPPTPDKTQYRKVSVTLGSAQAPMGQFLFADFKLKSEKAKKDAPLLNPMPSGDYLCLIKAEDIAKDVSNKKGDVVLTKGHYLSIGLPAMKAEDRRTAEKWEKMLVWDKLVIHNEQTQANAAGQFPNENLYRDTTRVQEDQWTVMSLNDSPVVYIEPLNPKSNDKKDDAVKADDKNADSKAKKVTLWIWNPGGKTDDDKPTDDPTVTAPGNPNPAQTTSPAPTSR